MPLNLFCKKLCTVTGLSKEIKVNFSCVYRFRKDRVAALGFDLAAAHFIVHRGGKVRFKGSQEWTQQNEDEKYDLPGHYNENLVIEAIDASETNILYEGIECLCE